MSNEKTKKLMFKLTCYYRSEYIRVLVAHIYNPSDSGGRDHEDHSLKLAQANSSRDPI
jgi:hypothetical protein